VWFTHQPASTGWLKREIAATRSDLRFAFSRPGLTTFKIDPAVAQQLSDPDMKREELRELMKSIAYPEGWFYVERASVIMFGLQATLAPKLNGIQVGFPYIMQFMMDKTQARMAEAAEQAKAEPKPESDEAILN